MTVKACGPLVKTEVSVSLALLDNSKPVDELVQFYDKKMRTVLDKTVPLQKKEIRLRPKSPWYTNELCEAKEDRRKAERLMRKSNLEVHRQIYQETCKRAANLLLQCKKSYYSTRIEETCNDPKQLYRITNSLMGNGSERALPVHHCSGTLANKFGDFFLG